MGVTLSALTGLLQSWLDCTRLDWWAGAGRWVCCVCVWGGVTRSGVQGVWMGLGGVDSGWG